MKQRGIGLSSSALLLILSGAMAFASVFQFVTPNHISASSGKSRELIQSLDDWIWHAGPAWILMLWWALLLCSGHFRAAKLKYAIPISKTTGLLAPILQNLSNFTSLASTNFAIDGNIETTVDTGHPLLLAPVAFVQTDILLRQRRWIVIPALFFTRYIKYPSAFRAVLAHELAHFENRDIMLLFGMQQLLQAAGIVLLIGNFTSLLSSVIADGNFAPTTIAASVAGKSYLFANVFFIFALRVLVVQMESWREALADITAINACKPQDLLIAEQLLHSNPPHRLTDSIQRRVGSARKRMALVLTPREIFFIGWVISAVKDSALGLFAQSDATAASIACTAILSGGLYFGFFAALITPVGGVVTTKRWVSFACKRSLVLSLGAILATVCLQTVPLIITSVMMPQGYDGAFRYDAEPLLLSGVVTTTISCLVTAFFALIAAWISVSLDNSLWGILLGLAWTIFEPAEEFFFPEFTEGAVAPLVVATAIIVLVLRFSGKLYPVSLADYVLLIPFVAATVVFWAGYGDVNHLSTCSNAVATEKARSGAPLTEIIAPAKRAAERAPFHASGWLYLADIMQGQPGYARDAATNAENALRAPYLSSWNDKFTALVEAGMARRNLNTSDNLKMASDDFGMAEEMWRKNFRIDDHDYHKHDHKQVVMMLYNYACVLALTNRTDEAVLRLFEAVCIDKAEEGNETADALNDPSLASLNLAGQIPMDEKVKQHILSLIDFSAPALQQQIQKKSITTQELKQVLTYILNNPRS